MMRLTLSRSLATISGGVPLGANKPNQEPARNPLKPASSMVGTSGSERERWGLLTANGFNLPDSIRERTDGMVANIKCTRPASKSLSASAPLSGIGVISIFWRLHIRQISEEHC